MGSQVEEAVRDGYCWAEMDTSVYAWVKTDGKLGAASEETKFMQVFGYCKMGCFSQSLA